MMNPNKQTILPLKRTERTFVHLPGVSLKEAANLTPQEIATIAATMPSHEWEVVTDEAQPAFAVDLSKLEGIEPPIWSFVVSVKTPSKMEVRATEIGVSCQTLYKWRREGTDVFDDEQIRILISRRRNHIWQLTPKFKPRLS